MRNLSFRRLLTPAAMGAFVVVWFFVLRPTALGGPLSGEIVSGHSMEPLLHTGDLVVSRAQSAYSAGDLIVFRVPDGQPGAGASIVHRIVGGDGTSGFVTKGDNNPSTDPWHPRASDVIGRSWIELPGTGAWLLVLRKPLVLAAIFGGLFGFWFLTTDFTVAGGRRRSVRGLLPPWRGRPSEPVPDEAAKS
jgi:signal peptidase